VRSATSCRAFSFARNFGQSATAVLIFFSLLHLLRGGLTNQIVVILDMLIVCF
jgi:hypothetical protein